MWERAWRMTGRWRRLLLSLVSLLSLIEHSGDEFNLFLIGVTLPLMNFTASGPKRSLSPTDMMRRRFWSHCGRSTVGGSKTVRRWSMCRWVKSSGNVTPASWAMRWAARAIELALWIRSFTKVISQSIRGDDTWKSNAVAWLKEFCGM